jgi:hypothetical protein
VKRSAATLTEEERAAAQKLLDHVRAEITTLAQGDPGVAFRIRRFIHARLQLDGRPPRALQKRKFEEQEGRCSECKQPFIEMSGLHLHRTTRAAYSAENTVLVHRECHTRIHSGGEPAPD